MGHIKYVCLCVLERERERLGWMDLHCQREREREREQFMNGGLGISLSSLFFLSIFDFFCLTKAVCGGGNKCCCVCACVWFSLRESVQYVSYDARWLEEKKSDHFNIISYEKIKFIGFIYWIELHNMSCKVKLTSFCLHGSTFELHLKEITFEAWIVAFLLWAFLKFCCCSRIWAITSAS